MDIAPIHSQRVLLLVFQVILHNHIRTPLAIICKNLVHQDSEWDMDWMERYRDTYIDCTYDSEHPFEFSEYSLDTVNEHDQSQNKENTLKIRKGYIFTEHGHPNE